MKLLQKLKSLFKSEEKLGEIIKISLNEIEDYLTKKYNKNSLLLAEKTNNIHSQLFSLIEKLEEQTKILENLNLKDKKAEERLKQITELGRKEYVQSIGKLIPRLKEKIPLPYISNEIDNFAKLSAKSYHKTTILIGKEIENI